MKDLKANIVDLFARANALASVIFITVFAVCLGVVIQFMVEHALMAIPNPTDIVTLLKTTGMYIALVIVPTSLFMIVVIKDLRKARDETQKLALTDSQTGLANRNWFLRRLRDSVGSAERLDRLVAVLFLDLDKFKPVNDAFGHVLGDKLLKAVGERLKSCVRKVDMVARLGGDEFAIILTNLEKTDQVNIPAQRILRSLSEPIMIDGNELSVGTSIGVSFYPLDDKTPEELMRKADVALYQAKEAGRGTFRLYDKEMDAQARAVRMLENDLRLAVERDEFVLHYQPLMDVRSGEVVAAEALIRWQHPKRGMVPPGEFIPVCDANSMIIPIGEWVLYEACRQTKAWHDAGFPLQRICVNVSTRQFDDKNFVPLVEMVLKQTGLEPNCLELEITEGLVIADTERVIEKLKRLRDNGVSLSIDDFGTGYSSLAYLTRFPVHRIKIDRSFIANLSTNPGDAAITDSIIQLGHSLKLRVVAEGVETEEHLNHLRNRGCDEVQGFFYSKPVPAEEFSSWVQLRQRLAVVSW